jgi:hypothetical protein
LQVTEEDRATLDKAMGAVPLPRVGDFPSEIAYIRKAQRVVATLAPGQRPIPKGQTREPADLVASAAGLCHDRTRFLEKALRHAGFRVRHVAIYSLSPEAGAVANLFALAARRRIPSHAVTECLTRKGWVVVDPTERWLSIDAAGDPIPLRRLQQQARDGQFGWHEPPNAVIYRTPFVTVYGLYSRHGRFYPPFNPIPDVNWREMLYNLRPGER